MPINTNTFESNLTTKINATSGTTDAKEFLLLGKAIEAVTPSVVVQDVIDEGTTQIAAVNTAGTTQVGLVQTEGATQVAAVQAAGSGYAALTGATFTGGISGTTATFSGNISGADLTLSGNLTVNGTQTVINSTTMTVDDANITIASGAADAAAANGAGITVDGASANITYTSATDTWDFNKAITGTYTNLSPVVQSDTTPLGAHTLDMNKPMHHITMSGGATYFSSNKAAGKTAMMVLDTSTTPHTPLWHGSFKWANATQPTWSDYRYWVISLTCLDGSIILASASGYTV